MPWEGGASAPPRQWHHARMEEVMDDLVKKLDRAKELLVSAGTDMMRDQEDAAGKEVLELAVDAVGELLANSRRIATALETIAANTKPMELVHGVTAELGSFELDADALRPTVERILADHGLVSPVNRLGG
jgi:hypothetical protein